MHTRRTAVVGAGIGGLGVALGLLDKGLVAGPELTVLDAEPGSGRIQTHTSPQGAVCDLGAARYNPLLHPSLHGLLDRFGVRTRPYVHRVRYPTDEVARFAAADLSALGGHGGSFLEALSEVLGAPAADRFCASTGYGLLRDHRFSAPWGLEIVTTHPEVFRAEAYRGAWRAPVAGLGALVRGIRDHLRGAGVRFLQPARLVGVRDGSGGLDLDILAGNGARRELAVEQLVLAVPPGAVPAIRLPVDPAGFDWYPHLVDVPMFKGYLVFHDAWWRRYDLDQVCVVADNELQKIFFDSAGRTVSFYCDSANADLLNRLRAGDTRTFHREVAARIEQAVGRRLPQLAGLTDLVCRYWPAGVTYLGRGAPAVGPGCVRIADRILLGTCAFSRNPGWVEGALDSAGDVVSHLAEG
ncbi:FAD-dependent oxidoreductase [Longispora sp. NPDC051575]|uniref:FAD-dependent oxidoreductase n=1 Tax=Longispora sp. NPDC051575 TaxID=3154943 RepID=UPI00344AF204